MQSHLTRRVFRAILNNELLSFSRCRNRLLYTARHHRTRRLDVINPYNAQRRSLFAFSMAPPANTPQPSTLPSEAGLKPMRDLKRALSDKSRGPAHGVLAKAFHDFFVARAETWEVITGYQAQLLSMTWKYLRSHEGELEPEDWQVMYSTENLENMLFVLSEAKCLPESRDAVLKVARFAFLELCADHGYGTNHISRPALSAYINFQALNGNPEEARHVVEKFWSKLRKTKPSPWLAVMRGFAMNDDKNQLRWTTKKKLDELGIAFDRESHEELVKVLIEQDLLSAVKIMYECPISGDQEPTLTTKEAVVKYALLKSEASWAQPIVESVKQEPISGTVGIILLWAAAHGKDGPEIFAMVQEWMSKSPEVKQSLAIAHVNNLMEYANSIKNSQLSAEFYALASQWSLQPDIQTRLLRLESDILSGDVNQTLKSVEEVQDIGSFTLENLPLMNRLLTMLCLLGQDDALYDRVSTFLDPLFENNVRLEAETLAAMTHMLLYRHDWQAVSDLLRPRLGSYDSEERTKIRQALTAYIMDADQDSADAWEAYGLLQVAFPETGVGMRTDIMTSFFRQNRGDLAVLVFGHMRQAEDFTRRPKPDTYARCFQGIAQMQDAKNLELVHNMLKLDVEVDLNTRLLNELMIAYAACDMPDKSMEIFRGILQSEEGPSQKTIWAFFKMCEKHHHGAREAMRMMDKVKLLEIELDRRLYMAYVEALAAQCEFDLATEAVTKMHEEIGCHPTRDSKANIAYRRIGRLYNSIPYQFWKDEVEKWAKVNYSEQWAQLEQLERTDHEEGFKFELGSS
ncbi:putative mitochondrial respiratory complex I chaperone (Cia84) [Aspergillus clavatus NRRL 1]|uniref:Mitochondrial respiratory complex I chaperone (Cia84), putative n=1 Tax=Aspergillus clavatus (strain ATCC 1007 / CBS 513.65 / DSM 816 / NCTC 3887 / NRRL 1 / QM 1276 / 107) TaxID=344612 RepID=A1C5Y3_ASPCL|nr:mitochondrial respiratory complex I chaperone (Cia84), putative [Aspergillus clavatus NRRL 1]EAW13804.1 mitochondrial respiratory complex I chaperone (Cia84), putative [Aspergillus clavatus NRRL 1]